MSLVSELCLKFGNVAFKYQFYFLSFFFCATVYQIDYELDYFRRIFLVENAA